MITIIQGAVIGAILGIIGLRVDSWKFWIVLIAFMINSILENELGQRKARRDAQDSL